MDKKEKYLLELHSYIESVDKEVTMLLQSLQWDRKHLLEGSTLVPCRYNATHEVPPDKKESHEKECLLRCEGYTKEDIMLPDPLDPEAPTVVKLSKEDIQQIINTAAQADQTMRKGAGSAGCQPLTADRLRACYSADERLAIHDAVVSTVPDFEHVEDIDLSSTEVKQEQRRKSKLEVLAELRDMRRRRAKYRGATLASNNYSNVLRELIKTQMELYTGTSADSGPQSNPSTSRQSNNDKTIHIKQETTSNEESGHTQEHSTRDRYSQRNGDRDYCRNRDSRDNVNRSQRDSSERHQYRKDSERNRYTRTYDNRRRDDVRTKKVSTPDGDDYRREGHREKQSSHQEHREIRHKDRQYEIHKYSRSKERNVNDSNQSKPSGRYNDSRRKESTKKRYSRDSDNEHSKSKTRRKYSDDSSSRDAYKHGKDYNSTDESRLIERHHTTKHRERSRSKAKERDAETDRGGKDDMYKRYYAMKRALADEDSKRKKYS